MSMVLTFRQRTRKDTSELQWQAQRANGERTTIYVVETGQEDSIKDDKEVWSCSLYSQIYESDDGNFRICAVRLIERIFTIGDEIAHCFLRPTDRAFEKKRWHFVEKKEDMTILYTPDKFGENQPDDPNVEWQMSILRVVHYDWKKQVLTVVVSLKEEKVSERAKRRRNRKNGAGEDGVSKAAAA